MNPRFSKKLHTFQNFQDFSHELKQPDTSWNKLKQAVTILTQSGYSLNTVWIQSGYNLDTVWIQSEYSLDTIWIQSGRNLNTIWTIQSNLNVSKVRFPTPTTMSFVGPLRASLLAVKKAIELGWLHGPSVNFWWDNKTLLERLFCHSIVKASIEN